MVPAGYFDLFPDLQVTLKHWGELILFYAERIANMDRVSGLNSSMATYFRRNLYVTARGMFMPHYLEQAARVVGRVRLLFSIDYPYQHRSGGDARRFLENSGLDQADRQEFANGNWERLTGNLPYTF
nr:amidohydrolase family protein [Gluconobacter cerinus]